MRQHEMRLRREKEHLSWEDAREQKELINRLRISRNSQLLEKRAAKHKELDERRHKIEEVE